MIVRIKRDSASKAKLVSLILQVLKKKKKKSGSISLPETLVTGRQPFNGPLKQSQPMNEMHFCDWSDSDLEATGNLWFTSAYSEVLPCELKLEIVGEIFPEWDM